FSPPCPPPPRPPPFPYTTLFRSDESRALPTQRREDPQARDGSFGQLIGHLDHARGGVRKRFDAQADTRFDIAAHRRDLLAPTGQDRKSTRLNSSHVKISYAVFCL